MVVFLQLKLTALAHPLRRSRCRVVDTCEWEQMLVGYHDPARLALRAGTLMRFVLNTPQQLQGKGLLLWRLCVCLASEPWRKVRVPKLNVGKNSKRAVGAKFFAAGGQPMEEKKSMESLERSTFLRSQQPEVQKKLQKSLSGCCNQSFRSSQLQWASSYSLLCCRLHEREEWLSSDR
jgi:hypothetical protein